MGGRDGDLVSESPVEEWEILFSTYYIYTIDASSPTRVFVFSLFQDIKPWLFQGLHRNVGASRFNGPYGRQIMFLRSNQGGRFDGNESVADSFRSDLVNFKSSCTTILGAFYLLRLPEKPSTFEAHLLPEVNPIRRSLPLSKLSNIQLCVT
ncbi:hypothetical protein TNCV_308671 [Trichonephila clavipes]|nr:hypothetical protein TNCV_308671 [Trichonephila clavipes]